MKYRNLTHLLQVRSVEVDKGIYLINGQNNEEFVSYKDLYNRSLKILGTLQKTGIQPGHELVIQVDDNGAFIELFWSCILGGIIPVPLSIGAKDEHKRKLFKVWTLLNSPNIACDSRQKKTIEKFATAHGYEELFSEIGSKCLEIETIDSANALGEIHEPSENDIAFIQFSSGSTGSPKGVQLTHKNLLTNVNSIAHEGKYTSYDKMLSWMPLTHDMGLIGFHINPMYSGMSHCIIPTNLFIRRPMLWLEKTSSHKATIICSPNFGYRYALKHFKLDEEQAPINLSSVRIIYNGAEPISLKLAREFNEFMAEFRLSSNAMCPVYGLAEASLAVSISNIHDAVKYISVDSEKVNIGDIVALDAEENRTIDFVNVGSSIIDTDVAIFNEKDEIASDSEIGYVKIKGDNVTSGYYNNDAVTESTISNGWLNTGDLGFLKDDHLFITGRSKEIIFVNGQNYYPHDIEDICCKVDNVELNKVVACGNFDQDSGKEQVLLFVFHRGKPEAFIPTHQNLISAVSAGVGIEVDKIIPVKDIPRTTSGKLQRLQLLNSYLSGEFNDKVAQFEEALEIFKNSKEEFVPQDEIGEKVVEIWKQILGVDSVSKDDGFIESGGNSLKAAELCLFVQRELGITVSFEAFFQNNQLESFIQFLQSEEVHKFISIGEYPKSARQQASYTQTGIYFAWKSNKESVAYNIPVLLKVSGDLNLERLQFSFQKLVNRHETLRSNFSFKGHLELIIQDQIEALLEVKDLNEDLELQFQNSVLPFDLEEDVLVRAQYWSNSGSNDAFLFLDFHHAIVDGISVNDLINEFWGLYDGSTEETENLGYSQFVQWEKDHVELVKSETAKHYWKEKLSNLPEPLQILPDVQRPAIFSSQGNKLKFTINEAKIADLRALAQEQKSTLSSLLFSIYKLLLYKYSGEKDFIVGMPVSGRIHPDMLNIPGMYVNNICLRNSIQPEDSFLSFMGKEHVNIIESITHSAFPFEELIRMENVRSDASRNPIFDYCFVYQNFDLNSERGQHYFIPNGTSKYDLTLEVIESNNSLTYYLEYAEALYSEEDMLDFSGRFEFILDSILNNPRVLIKNALIESHEETNEFLKNWNNTDVVLPPYNSFIEIFKEFAEATPVAVAVSSLDQMYTYVELWEASNNFAQTLRSEGITHNDTVVISMRRSELLLVALLGTLKAGATFVPVDIDYPESRLKYIIQDCRARFLVLNEGSANSETNGIKSIELTHSLLNTVSNDTETNVTLADTAYILYTSGTSGNPKGVRVGHASLLNYLLGAKHYYAGGQKADYALHTSISFDLTITSLFTPLISGGRVIVYPENTPGASIDNILLDNKVNVIKLTPSHLDLVLKANLNVDSISSLKTIIVGGEKFDTQLAKNVHTRFGGNVKVFNEYGPTEATVGCMIYEFKGSESTRSVPIGKPFMNSEIYLLDEHMHVVPNGVQGEIYISGNCLSQGYTKRQLTEEKFVENPYRKDSLLYRTGDLAYITNNEMVYIGRKDDQFKLNGYRIEPSEIEFRLEQIKGVRQSVVAVKQLENERDILVAYLVVSEIADDNLENRVRKHVSENLPFYMVPSHLVVLPFIPLNVNGKVDYNELPNPVIVEGDSIGTNNMERILIDIWTDVLKVSDLSQTDNFYDIGGDSIKAVQISSRMSMVGYELKVKDILIYQTIQLVSECVKPKTSSEDQSIQDGFIEPLPAQNWFFRQNMVKPECYNHTVVFTMKKFMNFKFIENAMQSLIEHHDGLRLNVNDESELYFNNDFLDDSFSISIFESEEEIQEWLKIDSLENRLLIKGAVLKKDEQQSLLYFTAHHLLIDGISWRILLEDLIYLYEGLAEGNLRTLSPKTAPLGKCVYLFEDLKSEMEPEEKEHWKELDNHSFEIEGTAGELSVYHQRSILDASQTSALKEFASTKFRSTPEIILVAALVQLLHEHTNQDQILIDFEGHGRNIKGADIARTIGWFTSMYPVLLQYSNSNIMEEINMVKDRLNKVPNHGIGYNFCTAERGSQQRKPQVLFNYLGEFGKEMNNIWFDFIPEKSGLYSENSATAKMEWNFMIADDQLVVYLSCDGESFGKEDSEKFMTSFMDKIQEFIDYLSNTDEVQVSSSDFDNLKIDQEELDSLFN